MKVLKIILKIILFPLTLLVYGLIYFYKFCISPLLPNVCKFTPTCSTYFLLAVKDYGVIKGKHSLSLCHQKHSAVRKGADSGNFLGL
jgi:putative component of membrane protein insertase Oxa1/YidC/SpoIIIJ protein YidD